MNRIPAFLFLLSGFLLQSAHADVNHEEPPRSERPVVEGCEDLPAKPDLLEAASRKRNPLLRDLLINAFDYRNPDIELSPAKFEKKKGNILYFVRASCPLARLYSSRLQELIRKHQDEFNFFVIFPSPDETLEDIAKSPLGKLQGAILVKDRLGLITKEAGVSISPTTVILKEDFTPVYQGPIDDQFGVGFRKPKACANYLESKLLEMKQGTIPPFEAFKTQGCEFHLDKGEVSEENKNEITYHSHIEGIIQRGQCLSCHKTGSVGENYPLDSYEDLVGFSPTAASRIASRQMPPWQADPRYGSFHDARHLPAEDIRNFLKWVENGTPKGKPTSSTTGLAQGKSEVVEKPDRTWKMEKPYEVPASGIVPYQYFLVDSGLTEDTWVNSVVVKPGTPRVVHHVRTFVIPPDLIVEEPTGINRFFASRLKLKGDHLKWASALWGENNNTPSGTVLGSYTPGTARSFPKEMGVLIPKGSKILFECHYTPDGEVGLDQSSVEVKFAKTKPKYQMLELPLGPKFSIRIPPEKSDYKKETEFVFPKNAKIVSFRPHMHLRGKSYEIKMVRPGKEPETLLSIPNWDYSWQTYYEFKTPIDVEKGTKIIATATWDNSKENPNNPDATATVTFGPDIVDEMAFAYMNMVWDE